MPFSFRQFHVANTWQTLFIITPPTELDLTESAVRGKGTGGNMYRKGRGRGGNPGRGGRGGRGKGGQGGSPPTPPVIDYKDLVLPYLLYPMAEPRALLEVPLEFEDVARFSGVIFSNLLAEYEHVISEGPKGPALKAMPASDGKLNLVSFALFGFGVNPKGLPSWIRLMRGKTASASSITSKLTLH